jgi:hypothetical protein
MGLATSVRPALSLSVLPDSELSSLSRACISALYVARTQAASASGAPAAQPGTKTPCHTPARARARRGASYLLPLAVHFACTAATTIAQLTEKGKPEPEEATLALAAMQPEYLPSCNTSDRLERLE